MELLNQRKELGQRASGFPGVQCFQQQEAVQPLLGIVQRLEHGPFSEIASEVVALLIGQIPLVPTHQTQ